MRKLSFLFVGFVFLFSSFVSAQVSQIFPRTREFFSGFYDNILVPVFSFLLGSAIGPDNAELFFAKILLFLILLSVIWVVIGKMPLFQNNSSVIGFISVAVSLLSVRFLSAQWVEGILLPYNTLGLAVVTLIPLVIYTYFVYSAIAGKTLQRIAWIVAGAVYILLFFSRIDKLGDLVWIYGVAALFCLVAVIFNHRINRFLTHMKIENSYSEANEELIRNLRRKLHEVHEDFTNGILTQAQFNTIKNRILAKIRGLS